MDEILCVVKLFAGNFVPVGFMECKGQLLSIVQYQAVYSILGNVYGGDGRSNFALPKIEAPQGMRYIICTEGIYPQRP